MGPTTEILLVRHGESESNHERRFGGHGPARLTALGERQASATARAIWDEARPVTSIHASDLARAVETAAPLASLTGLTPTLTPALRERSVGELTGLTFEEAALHHPDTWNDLLRRDVDVCPPGGESLRSCARRIGDFVDDLLAREAARGARVVLVSHGVALDALLRHLLGIVDGPSVRTLFHSDNCAIHRLERRGEGGPLRVIKINDTSHLAGLSTVEQR